MATASAATSRKRAGGSMPGRTIEAMAAMATTIGSNRMGYGDGSSSIELYQHYAGHTYSIIQLIGHRVAAQPVRVGRRLARGQKARKAFRADWRKVPLSLKDDARDGRVEVYDDHPILTALADPNPLMPAYATKFVTQASLEVCGRAFWWLRWGDRDGRRVPEIWPLPAHWVEPVMTEEELFKTWKVAPGGVGPPIYIPSREMVYFFYPDPSDPLSSFSPMQAMARTVMCDESVEESQRKVFVNSIAPKLAVIVGGHGEGSGVSPPSQPVLTRDQRRTLRTLLRQEYRGVANEGEVMLLDAFIKDIKPIFPGAKEMDYLQSSEATQDRLDKGWSIPQVCLGEMGSNRAESAVGEAHLAANVINPRLVMNSECMQRRMPAFFGDPGDVVYYEPAAAQDIDYELQLEESMSADASLSRNERRQRHGLSRIKGGDTAYVNGVEVPIEPETADTPKKRPTPGGLKRYGRPGTAAGDLGKKQLVRFWAKHHDEFSATAASPLAVVLERLGNDAADHLDRVLHRAATVRSAVGEAIDDSTWGTAIRDALRPDLARAVEWSAHAEWAMHTGAAPGITGSKAIVPRVVADAASEFAAAVANHPLWQLIAGSVRRAVERAIGVAKRDGTDPTTAARNELTGDGATARAATVAAAETQGAVEAGREAAYKQLVRVGRAVGREWVSRHDSRVRETHRETDGQIARGADLFTVGGEKARFPGDPSLSIGQRINCRCRAVILVR